MSQLTHWISIALILFRERILEEKKNDTITILTSHNKEDIEILADEKICMEFGKIKELM